MLDFPHQIWKKYHEGMVTKTMWYWPRIGTEVNKMGKNRSVNKWFEENGFWSWIKIKEISTSHQRKVYGFNNFFKEKNIRKKNMRIF